jgi:hypothetical protein
MKEETLETRGRPRNKKHEVHADQLLAILEENGLFEKKVAVGTIAILPVGSGPKKLAAYRAFRESTSFIEMRKGLGEQGYKVSAFHKRGAITVRAERVR